MNPESKTPITVETLVNAPLEKVWDCWTGPEHITQWNAASDDWHTPAATNDLREGGSFCYTMAARDGSFSFDFAGTYTLVKEKERIAYTLGDHRHVSVHFVPEGSQVRITEIFDSENQHPAELQRQGWQAILDNFRRYVEKGG